MSKIYTFEVKANITVEAESENEAREKMWINGITQEEDIDYNGMMVYISGQDALDVTLVESVDAEVA